MIYSGDIIEVFIKFRLIIYITLIINIIIKYIILSSEKTEYDTSPIIEKKYWLLMYNFYIFIINLCFKLLIIECIVHLFSIFF